MFRVRNSLGRADNAVEPPDPELRSRAAAAIRDHEHAHATLFDRAERRRGRAERLEKEGTPSESAQNRARRAENEVFSILAGLRASFAASAGDARGKIAFDQEIKIRYPGLRTPETSL